MDFTAVENLMADLVSKILGGQIKENNIRFNYSLNGQPGFKSCDDTVFIRVAEKEEEITRQRDIVYGYDSEKDTVIKQAARTRVWETAFIIYGPNAHSFATQIKDGVLLQNIKFFTAKNNFYLLPYMANPKRAPELFAGQWWNRWDLTLTWNELYKPEPEDVGRIIEVPLYTKSENTKEDNYGQNITINANR
ncbi:MAG: hypothetical protein ACI3ZR_09060 [bacterium]